ncbi:MAG: DNA polymerase III subunit delta [Elusimicrobia bacterium RIFCSPLOWO2_01_FULL_59_12]|nr:MAG: DNA polymerase III subunit delta [Elusimicrobia bacterium RIFCSPLOWO2_01_FULL_59_12]
MKADDLFAAWARGQYSAVYLFTGAEDFLIEEASKKLREARLPAEAADTNLDRLDAENVSANDILQACQTVPFLGAFRLVEVQNVSRLSGDAQKTLAEGLSRLPETTQLVLIWGKEWRRDDAEKPLVEAVMKAGTAVIFWPLFPEHAQRWAVQRARLYKKTLTPEAAAWLVQEAGEGLRRLDQELAKAAVYVGDRPGIVREDVEACFGYEKALSPFEWLTAVRQKKTGPSMWTLRQLLEEDEEPLKLLAMATYSVRDWIKSGEREEGLSYCVEAHQTIKTGKETPAMALTLLTLRLLCLPAGGQGLPAITALAGPP